MLVQVAPKPFQADLIRAAQYHAHRTVLGLVPEVSARVILDSTEPWNGKPMSIGTHRRAQYVQQFCMPPTPLPTRAAQLTTAV